jgi:methanogenic corrinoid protein MtbC1
MRMIALQREAFRDARNRSSATVLLAAVENERHVVGLEMAASALLHAGFDVRMLGADVPIKAIAAAVAKTEPAVLGLTAATTATAANARRVIDLVRRRHPALSVVIGGAAAERAGSADPATALCTHVSEAVEIVDALAQRAALN